MLRYQLLNSALKFYSEGGVDDNGPVYNVNLLAFRGAEGPERESSLRLLLEYWTALGTIIETKAQGQILLLGEVTQVSGADAALHPWHAVAVVRYPSLRHYHRVIQEDSFHQIKHLRRASLHRSVLYATTMNEGGLDCFADLNKCSDVCMRVGLKERRGGANQTVASLRGEALLVGEAGYVPWRFFTFCDWRGSNLDGNYDVCIRFTPIDNQAVERRLGQPMPHATSSFLSNL